MIESHRRNPLLSWYIGLVLILAGDAYVGWRLYATDCLAPPIALFIALIAMPAIYIALMYLTLKSQP